jgi:AcrR family transcriptional regulator
MTPAEVARRKRARKGEGDQLRDEILAATGALLLRTGSVDHVSIRAVADAVGVTPPSIYRHFEDKTALVFSVCLQSFESLADDLAAATVEGDPLATLSAQARAYVHYGVDHPEHYRLMFMTNADQTPIDLAEQMAVPGGAFALLLETVEAVIDAGGIRTEFAELGAATVGLHLWSVVHGITSLRIAKPALPLDDIDAFIDHQLAIVLHGMAEPT